MSDTLQVLDGDKVVFEADVQAMPLETWTKAVPVTVPRERLRVRIGKRLEWSGAPDAGALSRPLESPADFDWELGLRPLALRQGAPPPARLRPGPRGPRGVPEEGPALRPRPRRPRPPPLSRDGLPAGRSTSRGGPSRSTPTTRSRTTPTASPRRGSAARPTRGTASSWPRSRWSCAPPPGRSSRGSRSAAATSSAPPPTPSAASTSTSATSRATSSSPSPAASAAARTRPPPPSTPCSPSTR